MGWPRSGLPWIGFWLKELVNWGTLYPVAAFLLARGNARDRAQAEAEAQDYYAQLHDETEANDKLDPRRIRDWVEARKAPAPPRAAALDIALDVRLERPKRDFLLRQLSVFPLMTEGACAGLIRLVIRSLTAIVRLTGTTSRHAIGSSFLWTSDK